MISYYDPSNAHGLILEVNSGDGSLSVRFRDEHVIVQRGQPPHLSSLVPNDCKQTEHSEESAMILEHAARPGMDMLSLELKHLYPPEADVTALRRLASLRRAPPDGTIEVLDGASFGSQPGTLESVFHTPGVVALQENSVQLSGKNGELQITFDASLVAARVDDSEEVGDLKRLVFAFAQSRKSGAIRLIIKPI